MPILGEGSRYVAEAGLALKILEGEAAYIAFSGALMAETAPASVASVLSVLNDLGDDTEAVTRAIQSGLAEDALRQIASIAETLGIAGTPYFVGPGGIVRGAGSGRQLETNSKPVSLLVSECLVGASKPPVRHVGPLCNSREERRFAESRPETPKPFPGVSAEYST